MASLDIPTFQPRLRVLNREQALAIHEAALEILEKTGFKMEHPHVLTRVAKFPMATGSVCLPILSKRPLSQHRNK